jgi:hypothetical protein
MAHRIPRFEAAGPVAGASLSAWRRNQENLKASAKYHNRINEYRAMLQAWRDQQVVTYAGYMIGFTGDTYESIMRDVEFLKRELPLDFVELFVATPLPGSKDHQQNFLKGIPMDEDLNKYDTTQPCMGAPKMSREELQKAYRDAWHSFYSRQHVETILKRRQDRRRRNVAPNALVSQLFLLENDASALGRFLPLEGPPDAIAPSRRVIPYYWRRTRIALWTARGGALLEMHIYHQGHREKYRHYMDVAITPDPIGKRTTRRSDDRILVEVPAPASPIQRHLESSDLKADVAMPDVSFR